MSLFLLLFLCVLLATVLEAATTPQLECELFVAESTIPNAGLGMFSAVEKKPGDEIGEGDLGFPALYIDGVNGDDGPSSARRERIKKSWGAFEDFGWDGTESGMMLESLQWKMQMLGFGFYTAANSVVPLANVDVPFPLLHSSHGHDLPYMPHRSIDPGAGAVATYRAAKTTVIRQIPAGGEAFVNYGDGWFASRSDYMGENVPLSGSFLEAHALLNRYEALNFSPLYDAVLEIRTIWMSSSRVLNALPANEEDLTLALEYDIEETYQKNATRSLEWLREHGTCVDHTTHKPSTVAGVGEGAFAKRRLPQGTVITGSPLWTLEDDSYLDLGDAFENGDGEVDRSQMKQILYNYCFGHEETSLLFLPYAAAGALYINHGSGPKANVGVQWASPGKLRHDPSLFELSPDHIMNQKGPHLGIEFIALRDIDEGDELFLDYGEKWQEAWDEHVKHWRPVKDDTIAMDWNAAIDEPIRTKDELFNNPYPTSIVLRCHVDLLTQNESTWAEREWSRHAVSEMYGHACEVTDRSPDNSTYKVTFKTEGQQTLDHVPREALFFLDAPHKSDIFLENAFRFTVQLPNAMVPKAWRNKKRNMPMEAGHGEL